LSVEVLLITPPFTQLNTPYPATAYLKGFLETQGISSFQCDLGLEVILQWFRAESLTLMFDQVEEAKNELSANASRILHLRQAYIETIEPVIGFLQGKDPMLAHRICMPGFLPQASRFAQGKDLDFSFGNTGLQDKAKYLGTLYLEDLADFIQECVDEHFGFSRYAERLARSAHHFDELASALQNDLSFTDKILLSLLEEKLQQWQPRLVALSIPFPGNLFSALRIGQYIRKHHPHLKIAWGGGFPNTELRSLSEPRVFQYVDFICLDDGEAPFEILWRYMQQGGDPSMLKRTFMLQQDLVVYQNGSLQRDYKQSETGTPNYQDLLLRDYISVLEVTNPMHRLWSDGRWNKLTMAHGCYWRQCTFCDISLSYIQDYEPLNAKLICDRIETILEQTGESGFHFVDEAAPPSLMKELAIEIIRRKIKISWWTNIRFEKSFTRDLCFLLKAAGCIGVSGGLEVASDRLLALIQKGVTVAQVSIVNKHFTEAGIMVHAYLMYGFPTQTAQETIDSLETVRQMFEAGILKSAYWHQFAMTAHSPVGMQPEKYGVTRDPKSVGPFANNDVVHDDPKGAHHEIYSAGLKKSLFNYMNQHCIDDPLQHWFEHKIPKTTIAPDYIRQLIDNDQLPVCKDNQKVFWRGEIPKAERQTKSKKGRQWEVLILTFETITETVTISLPVDSGTWFLSMMKEMSFSNPQALLFSALRASYEEAGLEDFDLFWYNKPISTLYKYGLWVV